MVALIIVFVLVVSLWTVVLALGLPIVIAVVPTLAVVLGLVAFFVVRKLKARAAARQIEQSLQAQGDAFAQSARPDEQPEVQAMQAEFTKALSALKTSKLGRGGMEALSVLPWHVIIGPPGAGKSTALRNSGLKFPYLSARGGGVRGVGGTRNCEWWLTNEAVILDTAGRYTTEDNDRDEWFAFLDMLARNRPKKPVNGLIVAVSLAELIPLDEDGAVALGQKLRERVDEVMSRLKIIVPVYLLFTKCDLLPGFVELFGELPKSERGQIWGFTLPVGAKAEEQFGEKFDELAEIVEEKALQQMPKARRLDDRERLFQFPAQFEALKANTLELVRTLFAENVYQDTPWLRGAYFTSGTQEGQPIDRVTDAMLKAFGIPGTVAPGSAARPTDGKSYFLRDVFSQVIFPDRKLAVRSTREATRQKQVHYASAAGVLALALLLLSFPTLSFFRNYGLIQATRAQVAGLQAELTAGGTGLGKLGAIRDTLEALVQNEQKAPPWGLRFGMYKGDALLAATRGFYGAMVRKRLVEPVMAQRLPELEKFVSEQETHPTPLNPHDHVRYLYALKLHLLLSSQRSASEPPFSASDATWASRVLALPWAEQLGRGSDAAREVESHLALYTQLLSTDPSLGLERRTELVNRARLVLERLPVAALTLEQIAVDPALDEYDITLTSMLGGTVPELKAREGARVRGAFTKKGYDALVRDRLAQSNLGGDGWVLNRKTQPDSEGAANAELRALYFSRYTEEWTRFLEGLKMEPTSGSAGTLSLLENLTGGQPTPLARLFRGVAFNTRLAQGTRATSELSGLANSAVAHLGLGDSLQKAKDKVDDLHGPRADDGVPRTEKDVEKHFEGFVRFGAPPATKVEDGDKSLGLDVYVEQLQAVRDAVRADIENPADHAPLVARLQTGRVRVKSLIESQDIGWRPRFEALLWPPLDSSTRSLTGMVASDASQKWCSAVYSPFKSAIANHYPFNKNGHDAALADVASFFQPNTGTLWAFYKTDLQTNVRRMGERFELVRQLGSVAGSIYRPQVLTFLSRAQDVTNALFPPNSTEPVVNFSVHVQPSPKVASVTFTVDGQSVEYRNGPEEWYPLRWPGVAGKSLGASLKVRSTRGSTEVVQQEGEWGLFRLLEQASVKSTAGARIFTVAWHIQSLDTDILLDVRPTRSETPFFGAARGGKLQLLQPFRNPGIYPPAGVGRAGCSG